MKTTARLIGSGTPALLGLSLLVACSTDNNAQNEACRAMAHSGSLLWGYYPGYGCGPIPPTQTHFSGITTIPVRKS